MIECESQFGRGLSVCQTACCVSRPIFSTVSAKRYKTDKSDFSPDELLFTSLDRISFMTYFFRAECVLTPRYAVKSRTKNYSQRQLTPSK